MCKVCCLVNGGNIVHEYEMVVSCVSVGVGSQAARHVTGTQTACVARSSGIRLRIHELNASTICLTRHK